MTVAVAVICSINEEMTAGAVTVAVVAVTVVAANARRI